MARRKKIRDMTYEEVQIEITRLRSLILGADTSKHLRAQARKHLLQARMHRVKLENEIKAAGGTG